MKLVPVFIFAICLGASAKSIAQTVTLSEKNTSLKRVFNIISKQTGTSILYDEVDLQHAIPVTISVKEMPLDQVLTLLLKSQPLDFQINGPTIVIRASSLSKSVVLPEEEVQPSHEITGRVINNSGSPLEGATVQVKGTKIATVTDVKGNFLLTVPSDATTLVVSYIGFHNTEVVLKGQTQFEVQLEREVQENQEVVVVGYGLHKRVNLTGAVSTISRGTIDGRPITQTSQALQGLVPGAYVNTSSGEAGNDESTINIRGIGSLNQSSSPLVLIDGIEGSINDVAASDIETISVLKDAAAASIYGTRGAKGVILITTRRGKTGQSANFGYNVYLGSQRPTILPDMVIDNRTYLEVYQQAAINSNRNYNFDDADIERYAALPATDWRKVLVKKSAPIQNHEIFASGGTENIAYYASLGYLDHQGWLAGNQQSKRYNFRLNLDANITKRLKLSSSLSYVVKDANLTPKDESGLKSSGGKGATVFSGAIVEHPLVPAFTKSGYYASIEQALGIERNRPNGQGIVDNETGTWNENDFLGNVFLEYHILDGLKARATVGINTGNLQTLSRNKQYQGYDQDTEAPVGNDNSLRNLGSSLAVTNRRTTELTNILQLDYDKKIGLHTIKGLVGFNRQARRRDQSEITERQFGSVDLVFLGNGTIRNTSGIVNDASRLVSFFGRINYDFNGKYLLEANVRRDGSSRFGNNNRWGNFPSFSAGWIPSREKAWNISFINFLKIRGSWGILGSEPDDRFAYSSELQLDRNYIDNSGAAIVKLGNPELKWETTETTNIGLNIELFRSRLSIEADYFNRRTRDILVGVANPLTSGVSGSTTFNAASMQNRGWEAAVKYGDKIGALQYSIGFNITHVKNKILTINPDLADNADRLERDRADNIWWIRGEPINVIYGHQFAGVFQSQEEIDKAPDHSFIGKPSPGDIRYTDQNGDGIIDLDDRVVLGNRNPEWIYGASLSLAYKGFEFSALIQGVGDAYVNLSRETGPFPFAGLRSYWLDAWTTDNPSQTIPRVWVDRTGYNGQSIEQAGKYNSFWMQNMRYTRLKNVQLAYRLPGNMKKLAFLSNAKVYLNGQNLLTFTPMIDFDPERAPLENHATSTLPHSKTITFGLNLVF